MIKNNLFRNGRIALLCSVFGVFAIFALGQEHPQGSYKDGLDPHSYLQPTYLISPEDVLELYIVDVPELSRSYRVSSLGMVNIPLIHDPLKVQGLTLEQFANLVTKQLKSLQIVSDPQVTATVKESRFYSVAVTGAVKKPQIYSVLGNTTLLDVLSQAEGLAENASSIVNITRGSTAKRQLAAEGRPFSEIVTIDIGKLMDTGDPKLNVEIYPGDRVTVAPAGVVYVVGAVNKPGGFELTPDRKGLTVLEAIALAEDLKSSALRNKALIVRTGPQYPRGREEIPVRLKEIFSGKIPDIQLMANDILFVPDSEGNKAIRRAAEAAIQVATGVAIYRHP